MSTIINPINFTEPLALMRSSKAPDSFGQVIESFTKVRTIFCEVLPGTIGEVISNKIVDYAENYEIITWYSSDITSKDRVVYNGENFNVLSVIPIQSRSYVRLKIVKIYE